MKPLAALFILAASISCMCGRAKHSANAANSAVSESMAMLQRANQFFLTDCRRSVINLDFIAVKDLCDAGCPVHNVFE